MEEGYKGKDWIIESGLFCRCLGNLETKEYDNIS
jgi:hypothetical protein